MAMNKTELKQTVTKIKKFLKQRDYKAIDTGIELARGLNEPAVFEELLGGWSIDEEGALAFEEGFDGETLTKKWSDKTWPYFKYALWSLIGYAPEGTKVHASLVRSQITTLNLAKGIWHELPPYLAEFANLTSLDLSDCDALENVDGLTNCTQLTSLKLRHCYNLKNVDGLANCTQLTSLKLRHCYNLKNVDGLANCTQLTSLDLTSCEQLDVPPPQGDLTTRKQVAGYQDKIRIFRIFMALRDGDGDSLSEFKYITSLDLYGCKSLQNVDELSNLTQLTSLGLGSSGFESLPDGLANCTQLTSLTLSGCRSLKNVDGLANCTQLTSLNLRSCGRVRPKPSSVYMTTRKHVAAYQERIKKSMK